jgi:hypothetical protein
VKNGRVQAKDITDAVMLEALARCRGRNGVPTWSSLWDTQRELPDVPLRVVLAKLRSMVKRNLISGCCCGCRGDFELRKVAA